MKTSSVFFLSSSFCFVKRLTIGTRTSPNSIANAPALRGDITLSFQPFEATVSTSSGNQPRLNRHICTTVMPTPEIRLAQTAALVIFLENRPYINGARNAPASAPHEIDMRVEIYA